MLQFQNEGNYIKARREYAFYLDGAPPAPVNFDAYLHSVHYQENPTGGILHEARTARTFLQCLQQANTNRSSIDVGRVSSVLQDNIGTEAGQVSREA